MSRHVKSYGYARLRHIGIHHLSTGRGNRCLSFIHTGSYIPTRYISEPILYTLEHLVEFYRTGYRQHRIVRRIMGIEKPLHVIHGDMLDMSKLLPYRRITVRMRAEKQFA